MSFKLLGIAPYDALKTTMERIADQRDDIDLTCLVGDLEEGARLVKEREGELYDAIVSRGGTAREITKVTNLPVVDISLSVYDVLRAIRLADNYQEQYAIVGFENITEAAHLLCDLLQYKIQIVTIRDEKEAETNLERLQAEGCSMVICDMVTQHIARQLGMNAILITSGAESIIEAYDQAVQICQSYAATREENAFLRSILQSSGADTVVMSEDGEVFLSTFDSADAEPVYEVLRSQIQTILAADDRKFFRTIDRTLYSITSRTSTYKEKQYITFYFSASKTPMAAGRNGIHFFNKEEVDDRYFNSFFSIAGAMGNLKERVEDIARTDYPVMILAPEGTGKELLAGLIYSNSEHSRNPLIHIECGMMNDKNWEFLLNHHNSPFQENGNTIHFEHMEKMPLSELQRLFSTAVDTRLHKRNRLIFSAVDSAEPEIADQLAELNARLGCLNVSLPVLASRRGEIPPMANLYLSRLNLELGKQLIGFEPQAMKLLEEFDWPMNYTQFKRVLTEAATATDTSYIRGATIAEILQNERSSGMYHLMFQNRGNGPVGAMPDMTLQEMNEAIIAAVLEENKGNQSRTAQQLGISRTTLWRYINK